MVCIVVHYSEIGTKGKNREQFENLLVRNIRYILRGDAKRIYKRYGKIVCEVTKETCIKTLARVPGIANIAIAEKAKLDIEDIKETALRVAKRYKFKDFKVEASRSNKGFELDSMEINRRVGSYIGEQFNAKVKLKQPELTIYIEVGEREAFVYTEKLKGIGGLPVGASGRVVCSLSGGIDSPVAGFMMMKRGCEVIFVHMLNETLSKSSVEQKIRQIVKQLAAFQGRTKLYLVPFGEIQKEIIMNVPSKLRMIAYRRFMMRILSRIAEEEGAKAIVTGDSVGQVASQTLENLEVIFNASTKLVLSPLIGLNKQEIIEISKDIGTYEFSIQPSPDCCSYMIAQHPATKSNMALVEGVERNIKAIKELVEAAVKNSKRELVEMGEVNNHG